MVARIAWAVAILITVVGALSHARDLLAADVESARDAQHMFDRLDTDRNGRLTLDEATAKDERLFRRIFEMAGKPPSGDISRDEFQDVFERHHAGRGSVDLAAQPEDLVPLTQLGEAKYRGFQGGLYPEGQNSRPRAHEEAGLARARQVQPLNAKGDPDPQGTIVLLSLGMSNTSQLSEGFASGLPPGKVNPRVRFVNGAQGGMTASVIQHDGEGRGADYWRIVDDRLRKHGLTRAQVQAVWIKQADADPREGFPDYARRLEREQLRILELVHERFSNCGLAYLSSRTYGGYAKTTLNPEPFAYESGFAVKWLVERQIAGDPALNFDAAQGDVRVPWISWGPYLWANGAEPRADGFASLREDFREDDGTHHSAAGAKKVGGLVLDFFMTDSTTRPWFVAP